jgi:phosphatidate cytidylyltransferase
MHLKRWITGLVALPFLVFIIVKGGIIFSGFIGIVILIAQWEYFRIVFSDPKGNTIRLVMFMGYVFAVLIIGAAHHLAISLILHLVMLNFIISGFLSVFLYQWDKIIHATIRKQVIGVLYVPLLLSYLILMRGGTAMEGCKWIFFLLFVVFAGDIGALYTGTFWGKHKLIQAVSPKKTIEGSLGGIAANLLIGSCYKLIFMPQLPWGISLIFFLSLGIAGQFGDLFESGLKRKAHIKDSGSLLPGHGGILDRADALMFAAPVGYMFKTYLF